MLNKRTEVVSKRRHQNKFLLWNVKKKWQYGLLLVAVFCVFIFSIFLLFIFRQNSENMYMNYAWWMQHYETLSSIHIKSFYSNLISIIYIILVLYIIYYIYIIYIYILYIYIYMYILKSLVYFLWKDLICTFTIGCQS